MDKCLDSRIIRLKLVDGTMINGQVNFNKDPKYDRLSDLVSSEKEPFLILFTATIHQIDLDNPVKHKTLFVNKNHIIWHRLRRIKNKTIFQNTKWS